MCFCRLGHGIPIWEQEQMNNDNAGYAGNGKWLVSWNVNSAFLIGILLIFPSTCPYSLGLPSPWPYNFLFLSSGGWQHSWAQGCRLALPLSEPDRHQLPPVQKPLSPAEREDSLAQAQCVLMSLNSFWRKLMAFQHMEWVERCTSRSQHLLHWVWFAEVHVSVGKGRKMDRFLISCLFLPQTTLPWSLQIYHSWEGILWQLLIKILAAYYCSLQMMQMDHRLKQCWKAALSEVKRSLSITATCVFPHRKTGFKFF